MLALPAQAAIRTVPVGGNLQNAVNLSLPGDVIRLAGNVQANLTVDLALMGSAVGGSPGDLTIVGINGASATLLGGNGTRLVYSSATPFPGTLTLDSLTFSTSASTTSPAVRLENMRSVFLNNVMFDGIGAEGCAGGFTGCNGLSIRFQSPDSLLAIYSSTFRNMAGDALRVDATGGDLTVAVDTSLFTDNGVNSAVPDTGLSLSLSNAARVNLTVRQSSFSNLSGPAVHTLSSGSSQLESSIVENVVSNLTGASLGAVTHDTVAGATTAVIRAKVTDNQIATLFSHAVLGRVQGDGSTVELDASRNQIVNIGTSGLNRHGILVEGDPGVRGQFTLQATNNTINNVRGSGIRVTDNDIALQSRILNNTITSTNQGGSPFEAGIFLEAGTASVGGPFSLQFKIEGNTLGPEGLRIADMHADADVLVETNGSAADAWLNANNTYNAGGSTQVIAGSAAPAALNSTALLVDNRPPAPVEDSWGAPIGATSPMNILANDTDPDGDAVQLLGLQPVSVRGAAVARIDGGTPANLADDQAGYTGLLTETGLDRFMYVVRDPGGRASIRRVIVTAANDGVPPDTAITAAPANPGTATTVTFQFSGSDNITTTLTFECRLYPAAGVPPAFSSCTSPFTAGGLADGSYTFQARTVDLIGNVDPTPASYTWLLDTTAPSASITGNPTNPASSSTATFTFTGSDAGSGIASLQCSLDLAAFAACTSPQVYGGLADGSRSFRLRALDNAGNTSAVSTYTWVIDTTAPDTTITANPPALSTSGNASFSFTGSDAGTGLAGFQCALDGGALAACSSPANLTGLADGTHTFQVRAIDAAGNADATPATRTWVIDATPPPAPAITAPANGATLTTTLPTLAGTAEAGSSVRVQLDSVAVGTVTASGAGSWSLTVPSALTTGTHTVRAFAVDAAGNTSTFSLTSTFTINTSVTVEVASGSGQSAAPSTAFGSALAVRVRNALGTVVAGRTVTFTVPVGSTTAALSSATCVTGGTGECSVGATASATAGGFNVTASVPGGAGTAVFALTITAALPPVSSSVAAVPVMGLPGLLLLALATAGLGAWRGRAGTSGWRGSRALHSGKKGLPWH